MSQITTLLQNYRAGKVAWDEVLATLGDRDYPTPARMKNQPDDPFARELYIDAMPSYTDGTWDEVARGRNFGLLTPDEYGQILKRVWSRTEGGKGQRPFDAKGDVPGHDFHGNQWTGGQGGVETTPAQILATEQRLLSQTTEKAVLFTPSGKVLYEQRGAARSVDLSGAGEKILRDPIHYGQVVLTHNHPGGGGPLSDNDVRMAVAFNLAEMRAVSRDGYTYSLKPPQGGWRTSMWNDHVTATAAAINRGIDLWKASGDRKAQYEQMWSYFSDWAQQVGATYTRVPNA